jgi:hypothetical protein
MQIAEIREQIDAINACKWVADERTGNIKLTDADGFLHFIARDVASWPDALFIAGAGNTIRQLLDEVERLTAENARLESDTAKWLNAIIAHDYLNNLNKEGEDTPNA